MDKVGKGRTFRTYWLVRILERNKRKAENIRQVFLAKLEYINQVFDVIENDWNGADNFFCNGLKISQEEILEWGSSSGLAKYADIISTSGVRRI